jgi:hypothetical protein
MSDSFTDSRSRHVERMGKSWHNYILLLCCDNRATEHQRGRSARFRANAWKVFHSSSCFSSSFRTAKECFQFYWQRCVLLCDNVYGPDMCNTPSTSLYISFVCTMPIVCQLMSSSQVGKCECYITETSLLICFSVFLYTYEHLLIYMVLKQMTNRQQLWIRCKWNRQTRHGAHITCKERRHYHARKFPLQLTM